MAPTDSEPASFESDEDAGDGDDGLVPPTISESFDEVHAASAADETGGPSSSAYEADDAADAAAATRAATVRPFEALPELPSDVAEAMELFKLAILAHKVAGWRDIARTDLLAVLDSLRQLALRRPNERAGENSGLRCVWTSIRSLPPMWEMPGSSSGCSRCRVRRDFLSRSASSPSLPAQPELERIGPWLAGDERGQLAWSIASVNRLAEARLTGWLSTCRPGDAVRLLSLAGCRWMCASQSRSG